LQFSVEKRVRGISKQVCGHGKTVAGGGLRRRSIAIVGVDGLWLIEQRSRLPFVNHKYIDQEPNAASRIVRPAAVF
jgi:hypothetical protein